MNLSSFKKKWEICKNKKKTQLCISLDPATRLQRKNFSIPPNQDKFLWCKKTISHIAPYTSVIKMNLHYIREFTSEQIKDLNNLCHQEDLLTILDCKLADIGDTNESALYHIKEEGFDAFTFCPFSGEFESIKKQAQKYDLGIITLLLMSNSPFIYSYQSKIGDQSFFEFLCQKISEFQHDGVVIGAPSAQNHLKEETLIYLRELIGDKIVLMPGIGTQGGDFENASKIFGHQLMPNIGRSIIYSQNQEKAAEKYHDLFSIKLTND